jgi:hypothetical protein
MKWWFIAGVAVFIGLIDRFVMTAEPKERITTNL